MLFFFFFSSRRRHTRFSRDWSSDVCSSDLKRSERPSWARRSESSSSATSLVRSPEASRSVSCSFASSRVSISTIRWKLPRADVSSNSTHLDEVGCPSWAEAGQRPDRGIVLSRLPVLCRSGRPFPAGSHGASIGVLLSLGRATDSAEQGGQGIHPDLLTVRWLDRAADLPHRQPRARRVPHQSHVRD